MSLITKMLKEYATYWPLSAAEVDMYGQPDYGTAVEIKCRWEDRQEEYFDSEGVRKVSKARVYVASDIKVGGVLWQGRLINVPTSTTDPKKNAGAFEIKRFDKVPDIKYRKYLRVAYL